MFSKVLLTVDYDRTLTDPHSVIPQRNLEAIDYFIQNGGSFTVNTGRGPATFWKYLDTLPVNCPYLLYNGSVAYENGRLINHKPIDADPWQVLEVIHGLFPDLNLEIQGEKVHYLIDPNPAFISLYEKMQWRWQKARWGQDVGIFMKFALWGPVHRPAMGDMFEGSKEEMDRIDEAEKTIKALFGDKMEVFRAAPRIIDVHAKGVSKGNAARQLLGQLGKEILVCVGDAENDITMLEAADYAFCPADGVIAARYPNVCPCADGAVADVIYQKIPEILGL